MDLRIKAAAPLALAVLLGLLSTASSEDAKDDWSWDPAKRWKPAAGARYRWDVEIVHKSFERATLPDMPPHDIDESENTSFKALVEVTAVGDDGSVTEQRITFTSWKQTTQKSEDADTSLVNKSVDLKMNGKNRTYEIENGNASVSDAAKEWIQTYLVSGDGELEQEDLRKWLAPTGPVAAGAHWTGDVATIASALFRGAEVDPKHSTASGKLGTVKVQDGVHTGHWDAKATLKIKKSESGTEWQEGQQDISISVDGSLELDKSNAEDLRIDLKFGGKGEVKGKDPGKIEQKWQTTVKSKRIPDKTAEKKP